MALRSNATHSPGRRPVAVAKMTTGPHSPIWARIASTSSQDSKVSFSLALGAGFVTWRAGAPESCMPTLVAFVDRLERRLERSDPSRQDSAAGSSSASTDRSSGSSDGNFHAALVLQRVARAPWRQRSAPLHRPTGERVACPSGRRLRLLLHAEAKAQR